VADETNVTGPVGVRSGRHQALRPLDRGGLRLDGGFWGDRQLLNREVTIPHGMRMLEEHGNLDNLRMAAGKLKGEYHGPLFMDSDVYKLLEAIGWERQHGAAAEQERFLEEAGALLSAAQLPDGYINSYYQVVEPSKRFANPAMGHELYCAGHLFQAAVAEARSLSAAARSAVAGAGNAPSGQRHIGPVADRFAGCLLKELPARPAFVPGHPEIETAMAEMYRLTGSEPLLQMAAQLLGRRGHSSLSFGSFGPEYFQDDIEVAKAEAVRGHAVRALYLLSGAADVYMETGGPELLGSCLSQWADMVSAKTYLTAGVGSRHKDEAFGDRFELPPDRAYCETCAAIASIMWNWRMCLITGEARFAELVERTLYNGFLSGWGLEGRSFFYVNPLQSRGGKTRQPWNYCACCPPNLMRLVASLEHYVASHSSSGLQLHQFVPAAIAQHLTSGWLRATVETQYPQEGWLLFRLHEAPAGDEDIAIRAPSWASDMAVDINGKAQPVEPGPDGYLHLQRRWEVGDEVSVSFPLRPRVVFPDLRVDAIRGCAAIERGPFVYCFESLRAESEPLDEVDIDVSKGDLLEHNTRVAGEAVVELSCSARRRTTGDDNSWPYHQWEREGGAGSEEVRLKAIPYYAWSNRGPSYMRVWAPTVSA
jgi:uncharacterized protein